MKAIIPILRAAFAVAAFSLPAALSAGAYTLTASNYDDGSGNGTDAWCAACVELDSNLTANSGSGFSVSSGSSGVITLSNLTLRRNQQWKKLSVQFSNSGSDPLQVVIKNKNGDFLNGTGGVEIASSSTEDISAINRKTGASEISVEITIPSGLTLESLVITYSSNNVVLYPSPYSPSQGNATIKIDLEKKSTVTLSIYDSRNYLVKRIYDRKSFSGFDTPEEGIKLSWNGRNKNGVLVPSGIYTIIAVIKQGSNAPESLRFRFLVIR